MAACKCSCETMHHKGVTVPSGQWISHFQSIFTAILMTTEFKGGWLNSKTEPILLIVEMLVSTINSLI